MEKEIIKTNHTMTSACYPMPEEQPSKDLEEAAEKEYPIVEGLPNTVNDLFAHQQKVLVWHDICILFCQKN